MSAENAFTRPFTVRFHSSEEWEGKENVTLYQGSLVWYSDSSDIEGKSGYGVNSASPSTALNTRLGRYSTFPQDEVTVILGGANLGISNA